MDIDLNADLGEGFGPWRMGDDEALLDVLSSANVACGFHAGDPLIMDRTVAAGAGARRRCRRACRLSRTGRASAAASMQIDTARARRHGHLPARRAGRHRARGRAPHDAHELPWRAGQHGRRRRGAGRAAGARRRAIRPGADHHLVDQPRHRGRGRALRAAGGDAPSWPTAPTTTTACWCRASCRTPSSTTRPPVLRARAAAAARRHRHSPMAASRSPMRPRMILVHGDTPGAVALARAIRGRSRRPAGGSCRSRASMHGLSGRA